MNVPLPDTISVLIPKLRRRAGRLVPDRGDAEDLVQEAVLRLWQRLDTGADVQAPDRYAMIMLHNLVRQRWRRLRPMEELSDEMGHTVPLAPARIACSEICAAIDRLSPDQRVLMRLVVEGETSPQVLAGKLGLPKGTVMSRLGRARRALRDEIGLKGSVAELL